MKIIILSTLISLLLFANTLELYKNCAGCHGENGEKMALGQSKIITGQDHNLTVKQLTAYKEGELNMYGLGNIMQVQLRTFDTEEIEALARYIESME